MKVLIVGGGGREHAIAWKLKRDDPTLDLHCTPGNPGIESLAACHGTLASNLDGLVTLGIWERFDLTIEAAERDQIRKALEAAGGKRMEAARLLGLSRRTLYRKLDKYGIT